jgi:hypothetical protein
MKIELTESSIVIGCNYHTKWQSDRRMRFILKSVSGDQVVLTTRWGKKDIPAKVSDLIFIMSCHNKNKAHRILTEASNG